jgi:excinuclease UvrABC nuclease subunit
MKKTRFKPVYNLAGRVNIPETKDRSGVYLIKEKNKIVYVGNSASNVYKTAIRHFQSWNDPTQERVTYASQPRENYTIRFVSCTPKQAEALERRLILRHQPRDNYMKYENYINTAYDDQVVSTYDNTEVAPF